MDWLYVVVFLCGCGVIAAAVGRLGEDLKSIADSSQLKDIAKEVASVKYELEKIKEVMQREEKPRKYQISDSCFQF
jgi:hypothetical protein